MHATPQPNNTALDRTPAQLDVERVRADFPTLAQSVHGYPLAYLDNAATTQKPRVVIDTLRHYYERDNANIHRGVHTLSQRATDSYEKARETVRRFLGAEKREEIVFLRGATEALNLVAQSYARPTIGPGDEVLITAMEHHSNIVPWQLVCQQTGATLKVAPIDDNGDVVREKFDELLSEHTRVVGIVHVSNALGTVNPVAEMIRKVRSSTSAVVVVDGAQTIAHRPADVRELDADFYAFSGHKVFGPTGIGALYAKESLLEGMVPYQGGGDMIRTVRFDKTTYNDLPYR